MKKLNNNSEEYFEEGSFNSENNKHVEHHTQSVQAVHHRFFLNKEIASPSKYTDLIQILLTASEHDCVELVISSEGGNLESALNIISAIRNTEATVVATVTGSCHSAASLITLSCHEVSILDFGHMLCHHATYGSFGKGSEIMSHVNHMQGYIESVVKEIYKDFLTEDEIERMLSGVDYWFTAKEIRDRLEVMREARNSEETLDN